MGREGGEAEASEKGKVVSEGTCVWGNRGEVKRLVFLGSDRVTSELCVSTLEAFFSEMSGKVFMQDGAPARTAKNTEKKFWRKKASVC